MLSTVTPKAIFISPLR